MFFCQLLNTLFSERINKEYLNNVTVIDYLGVMFYILLLLMNISTGLFFGTNMLNCGMTEI